MARLPLRANTEDNKEGLDDFTAIEAGSAPAFIKSSQYKQTKAKNGYYLMLVWKIADGPHKGRQLFDNLNLDNPNPIAVEIANKSLNSICQAMGKVGVEDSEELHGIPIMITWKVTPATPQNPPGNSITAYKPMEEGEGANVEVDMSATTPTTEGETATPGTGAATKKLPWEK